MSMRVPWGSIQIILPMRSLSFAIAKQDIGAINAKTGVLCFVKMVDNAILRVVMITAVVWTLWRHNSNVTAHEGMREDCVTCGS